MLLQERLMMSFLHSYYRYAHICIEQFANFMYTLFKAQCQYGSY